MKLLFIISTLVLFTSLGRAQLPFITLLQKANFSSAGYYTGPVRTLDGGYMTASTVKHDTAASSITADLVISKLDSFGVLQWSKLYEGDSASILAPERFINDGSGFLLALHRSPLIVPYSAHIILLKFDQNGDTLWSQRFSSMVWCRGLFVRPDGNYIVIGKSKHGSSRAHQMVCLDSTGQFLWAKSYVPASDCGGNPGSIMTSDGGFLISGCGSMVTKFDSSGNFMWTTPLLEDDNGDDLQGWGVGEFPDGSILLVGSITEAWSNPMIKKAMMMKISSSGSLIWVKNFINGTYDTELFRAKTFSDGTMHLRGLIRSNPFTQPACDWLASIDSAGNILTNYKICDPSGQSYYDVGSDIIESPFGGMVTYGQMRHLNSGSAKFSDVLASHGTIPAGCNIFPGPSTVISVTTIQRALLQYVNIDINVPFGAVTSFNITPNVYTQTDFCLPVTDNIDIQNSNSISLYPNPASDLLNIIISESDVLIEINDMSGKTVFQSQSETSESQIDVSLMARGIYLVRIIGTQGAEVRKLVLR